MEFSRPEYWNRKPFPSPGGLPNPGIKPRSPMLQGDFFLPTKAAGKPKNTGGGSLSLLQWIFLTQQLNWDLLHCRKVWGNGISWNIGLIVAYSISEEI